MGETRRPLLPRSRHRQQHRPPDHYADSTPCGGRRLLWYVGVVGNVFLGNPFPGILSRDNISEKQRTQGFSMQSPHDRPWRAASPSDPSLV